MISLAARMQENEAGDGTNLVIVLAGELMQQAENLLKMGLHPSEILIGYEKAGKKCLELLDGLVAYEVNNMRDLPDLTKCIKSVVAAKHYGNEHILAPLIAEATQISLSATGKHLNVENVRVQKVLGGSLNASSEIHGMAISRASETTVKHVKNAKIAIFNTPLETEMGDTHGTVLLKTAEELKDYTKTEEANMEKFVQSLAQAGV
jgi:T-complex protein 1 subunit theta